MKRNKVAGFRKAKFEAGTKPAGNSVYAKKRRWLDAQEEPIPWGFQVADPKPWK